MDIFDKFTEELLEHNRKELEDQTQEVAKDTFIYDPSLKTLDDLLAEASESESDLDREIKRRMQLPENEGRSEISIRREILAEQNAMFMTQLYNVVNGQAPVEETAEITDVETVEATDVETVTGESEDGDPGDGRILLDLGEYYKNHD